MHDINLQIDHCGHGTLSVDGVQLQNFVRGFDLKSQAGKPAQMMLHITPLAIDGQVAIELRKLGIVSHDKLEMGRTAGAADMIELNYENLRKFFVWAKKQGSDEPYVDDGECAITIDGSIRREDLDRFISEQREFACEHHWVDVSTHNLEKNRKQECCTTCGEKREVDR